VSTYISLDNRGFHAPALQNEQGKFIRNGKICLMRMAESAQGVKKVTLNNESSLAEKNMPKIMRFLLVGIVVLAGCAPGKVILSTQDRRVETALPTVNVDRYEPVVFPDGHRE
jgi:hypothetical protein